MEGTGRSLHNVSRVESQFSFGLCSEPVMNGLGRAARRCHDRRPREGHQHRNRGRFRRDSIVSSPLPATTPP